MNTRGTALWTTGQSPPYAIRRPLELIELEVDPPGPGEVLSELHSAGICHAVLSVLNVSGRRPTPMLLGYEAAEIVIQTGEGTSRLRVGDHMVTVFVLACRHCADCNVGRPALCDRANGANGERILLSGRRRFRSGMPPINHHCGFSGFSQFAVMSENSLVRIDESVHFDFAALFGYAVLTGIGAVINSPKVTARQHIAIVGLSRVGMATVLGAQSADAKSIIATDTAAAKLLQAARLGSTSTFAADFPDLVGEIREVTGGGVDVALDVSGSVHALRAWQITRRGGKTVSWGLPDADHRFTSSPTQLVAEEGTVQGSYMGGGDLAHDIPKFVEWLRTGKLSVPVLIFARLPLEQINEGMDALAAGSALRQIIVFH